MYHDTMETWTSRALQGDPAALERLLTEARDLAFNLSLRMLGTFADAEDATQEILLKVAAHLADFKGESSLSTWIFRIAVNHLIDYRKHMFAQRPLSFEFYGSDIEGANIRDVPDLRQGVDGALLAEELKLSCTNVMLQCLDPQTRCIFVLGTMFRLDSRTAGEILNLSPEAYRQRLSRARRRMADFLSAYCGEYGGGKCRCAERVNYAIQSHRLHPRALDYTAAREIPLERQMEFKAAMEEIDGLSAQFSFLKAYESPERTQRFLRDLLHSTPLRTVKREE